MRDARYEMRLLSMKAMILAAGFGTRLRPLTDHVPKPLLDVAGQPMIAFALRLLRVARIRDVVVNLHHLGDQIKARLGDGGEFGVHITYSEEDPILDSGGGIAAARPYLEDDRFVVLNSDTFIDLDLLDVIAFHERKRALATMVVRPDPDALRRDDVCIDADGRIHRILGCGAPMSAQLQRCMYPGVMIFEPRIFSYLGSGVFSITRDTYPRLLAAGEPVYGFVHHGYWSVLDTPDDLAAGREEIPRILRDRSAPGAGCD